MKIRIFKDLNNSDLITNWKRITYKYDYFPQSYYEWCAAWWKWSRGKRKLHVVTVVKNNNKILAIAPLCIEKQFGFSVIRSFPIHFGDFYTFIVDKEYLKKELIDLILKYLLKFKEWNLIQLDQINTEDELYEILLSHSFFRKKLTDIIISQFKESSFEKYLLSLPKKLRKELKRRKKRFLSTYNLRFEKINTMDGYLSKLADIKKIYNARWGIPLSEKYYQRRNEALEQLFKNDKCVVYILYADNNPVAFKIGFKHKKVFYSWKASFDPAYRKYGPGDLITFYVAEDLINEGYTAMNFMAGGYDYKRKWASDGKITENYSFFYAKDSVIGNILLKYHIKWRDKIKDWVKKSDKLTNLINSIKRRYGV